MRKSTLAISLIAGSLVLGLGIPLASGVLRPLIVMSGSMEPIMCPGDMTIVKETKPEDIAVGDILAFKDPLGDDSVLITHRVLRVSGEGEKLTFETKGDAAENPDIFPVEGSDVVGKVIFNLPYLGYLFYYGQTPVVFFALVAIPAVLITSNEVRNISKYSDPKKVRRAERMDRKSRRDTERRRVDYSFSKFIAIFLIFSAFFAYLSLNHIQESGTDVEMKVLEGGLVSTVAVYALEDNSIPNHAVVSRGEELSFDQERISMLSTAPGFMPAFWTGSLAEVHPKMPGIVTSIVPPVLLTLLLFPIWRKSSGYGSRRG